MSGANADSENSAASSSTRENKGPDSSTTQIKSNENNEKTYQDYLLDNVADYISRTYPHKIAQGLINDKDIEEIARRAQLYFDELNNAENREKILKASKLESRMLEIQGMRCLERSCEEIFSLKNIKNIIFNRGSKNENTCQKSSTNTKSSSYKEGNNHYKKSKSSSSKSKDDQYFNKFTSPPRADFEDKDSDEDTGAKKFCFDDLKNFMAKTKARSNSNADNDEFVSANKTSIFGHTVDDEVDSSQNENSRVGNVVWKKAGRGKKRRGSK